MTEPETDHIEKNLGNAAHPILLSFCRKLERERNEARELLREIRDDEVNAQDECDKFLRDHVPSELSKVTEQRDRLAEALQSVKCELGVPQPEYPSPVANAYWIADEALQSLTKP